MYESRQIQHLNLAIIFCWGEGRSVTGIWTFIWPSMSWTITTWQTIFLAQKRVQHICFSFQQNMCVMFVANFIGPSKGWQTIWSGNMVLLTSTLPSAKSILYREHNTGHTFSIIQRYYTWEIIFYKISLSKGLGAARQYVV